jgi:DNA-binding response OmpR family regulator
MGEFSIINLLSDKKILYAEDEKGIRQNIIEVLELFFQKVDAVENGLEAIEKFSLATYDVLMFDISMPHMDGLEAIKEIRKTNKKIPIIILSAHTEQAYLWRAVELKITKFITKPCNKEIMTNALEQAALELVGFNTTIRLTNDCLYNPYNKTVCRDNRDIKLSKSESRLLEYFIYRANESISYEMIYHYMWEFETPSKEAIKSIVKELRRKIDKVLIKNIYGVGYMLEME